ncbi:MAG: YidC/Oxa1 family membrane protein insertase [Actinomycetota bacterium]
MIAVQIFQTILDGLGAVLAWLYDVVGNYGVAIILFTIAVRILLLPLGIKQIRSMHAMQSIQPKIKAVQAKHKGNRQKQQEEMMKLYQEHGVNPLGSCLPLLLQLPVMIALYSVLRVVPGQPTHFPEESALNVAVVQQNGSNATDFLGMDLQCSALQAGHPEAEIRGANDKIVGTLDCGEGVPARIPFYMLMLLMVGTSYYQALQMRKSVPQQTGQSAQQQKLMQYLPVIFSVIFISFPAGLVLYWTTTNAWQIGQQHFLFRAIKAEQASGGDGKPPKKSGKAVAKTEPAATPKKGFMARMVEQAETERARKQSEQKQPGGGSGTSRKKRRKR